MTCATMSTPGTKRVRRVVKPTGNVRANGGRFGRMYRLITLHTIKICTVLVTVATASQSSPWHTPGVYCETIPLAS